MLNWLLTSLNVCLACGSRDLGNVFFGDVRIRLFELEVGHDWELASIVDSWDSVVVILALPEMTYFTLR